MSSVLKGNFQTAAKVETKKEEENSDLESRFEMEAMKRLGGSIAFVKKKTVVWDLKD
ncbi:MAG: hypothetical protein HQL42_02575 [Alphaproteobacteria bacterium]|nr:hypothetical protein [Alphaproteobacteria bacterium]